MLVGALLSCSGASVPAPRDVDVPTPERPAETPTALNEQDNAIIKIELGDDVLKPRAQRKRGILPRDFVGPFELRGETLATALQLILAEYDVSIAFETEDALTRQITVTNLRGPLNRVVDRLCSLAGLYCLYEDQTITVKQTQTFAVNLPPLSVESYGEIANGLEAVVGAEPVVDSATRTIVYTATHRNQQQADDYFERLRANTALIVYETHIWEVNLNNNNQRGINWGDTTIPGLGNFNFDLNSGARPNIIGGLDATAGFLSGATEASVILDFLSTQGAVKTISQPQITVLSGASANLRVGGQREYINEITRSVDEATDEIDLSVSTATISTGLTMSIDSAWDNATVYGTINITLDDLIELRSSTVGEGTSSETELQLPETSTRNLQTQVRMRPGDVILIGGIVQEKDNYEAQGPSETLNPILNTSRTTTVTNTELVFMIRPRVIVYTDSSDYDLDRDSEFVQQIDQTQRIDFNKLPVDIIAPQTQSDSNVEQHSQQNYTDPNKLRRNNQFNLIETLHEIN